MKKTFSRYHSYFSKVLLGLACLWSVFLFSGYVENNVFALPETVATELTNTKGRTAPIVSFQKVQAFRYVLSTQNNSPYKPIFALENYNTLIETAFLQLQKEGLNYIFWKPSFSIKYFLKSTVIDTPTFLIA